MAKKSAEESKISRFWFASTSADKGREQTLKVLRKATTGVAHDVFVFDVPQNLKFGSFDDLIRLLDDITKQENSLEGVLKRVQRQALDLNPEADFQVTSMRQTMSVEDYIRRFQWDEARYPKNRNVVEILDTIVQQVNRLDDDIKQKLISYNETKQTHAQLQNKSDATLHQKDLVDVFGGEADPAQLVSTENLISIPVIVPKMQEQSFLDNYSKPETAPGVVPTSAYLHKDATDKDGNLLYTVVVMRRNRDEFVGAMRKLKCLAKDYTHEPSAADNRKKQRAELMAEKQKQEQYLTRVCVASFSDILMALVHLKALKIFVDSVLRMGVPVNFCAFTILPTPVSKQQTKLWAEMTKTLAAGDAEQYKEENYNPFAFAELFPFA